MKGIRSLMFGSLTRFSGCTLALWICCLAGCTLGGGFLGYDRCIDSERGEVPEPVGNKTTAWQAAQASAALQDQTTLYKADFVGSSTKLSPNAIDKIYRAIKSGIENRFWLVEPSGDSATDDLRVTRIKDTLEANGVTDPNVMLAIPNAIALPGPFGESSIRNSGIGNRGFGQTGNLQQFRSGSFRQ